ncbi:hypothetical protein P9112_002683 [Eukaryota sp. TZLM1-RC]
MTRLKLTLVLVTAVLVVGLSYAVSKPNNEEDESTMQRLVQPASKVFNAARKVVKRTVHRHNEPVQPPQEEPQKHESPSHPDHLHHHDDQEYIQPVKHEHVAGRSTAPVEETLQFRPNQPIRKEADIINEHSKNTKHHHGHNDYMDTEQHEHVEEIKETIPPVGECEGHSCPGHHRITEEHHRPEKEKVERTSYY